MGHANGIITAPVNTYDVVATLGENSHDIGALCSSERIRPWSKFKPTVFDSVAGGGDYWKGDDGKCGFIIEMDTSPYYTSYTGETIRSFYNNRNNWKYNPPSPYIYDNAGNIIGGREDWCRLADFVGYNHNCVQMLQSMIKKGRFLKVPLSGGVVSLTVKINRTEDIDTEGGAIDLQNNLSIKDFYCEDPGASGFYLKDCYLAAVLAFQENNPIEVGFGQVGYDAVTATRVAAVPLSNTNGNIITITDFQTGFPLSRKITDPFWVILGLVFGPNKRRFIGIPWNDDNFYAFKVQFVEALVYPPIGTLVQWAKYGGGTTSKVWHNIKWINTDDTVAVPYGIDTHWQVKMNISNSQDFGQDIESIKFINKSTGKTISPSHMSSDFVYGPQDMVIPAHSSKTICFDISDLFSIPSKNSKATIEARLNDKLVWSLEFQGADSY